MIDAAQTKIDGDAATVTIEGGTAYKFKKVDGQWKALPEVAGPLIPANEKARKELDRSIRERELRVELYAAYYQEVRDGKYPTYEKAIVRMMQINDKIMIQAYEDVEGPIPK